MSSATPSEAGSDAPTTEQSLPHLQYKLKVTAGTSYSTSTHRLVPVNAPETLTLETSQIILSLAVRIRHFTGFPTNSPVTSSYFENPAHQSDQYSIAFSFIPKVDIPGTDLVFGNDFDRPIRDRLPPGFGKALKIVQWWIDPGLEGDVYSDTPYLYGPALSSWNILSIGHKASSDTDVENPASSVPASSTFKLPTDPPFHSTVIEEGATGNGESVRSDQAIPADAAARKKLFLSEEHRKAFIFEAGRLYQSDFGNPYLDFNDFSLKLPGFSLNVLKYVDSKSHELRYTLKNRVSGEVYAAVLFTLIFGEELKQEEEEAAKGGNAGKFEPEATVSAEKEKEKVGSAPAPERDFGAEPPPGEDDLD